MQDRLLALQARALDGLRRLAWLPPLVTRVAVGWVFVESGWGKLHDLQKVIDFFRELGIPYPELQAPFAAGTELACGTLLLLGLATRLVCLPLAVLMTVAIATALWPDLDGASDLYFKGEFLFLVLFSWIGVHGPGPLALDAILMRRLRGITSRDGARWHPPSAGSARAAARR
jgi:putative oxidoreductase